MRPRRLSSFIEALLHDRKPRPFQADPEDAQAIRAAVGLRARLMATATPTRVVVMPATAIGVTDSWRNARPTASATIGMMSVVRLTIVASILLIK